MKRLFALILSICLMTTLFAGGAFAESGDPDKVLNIASIGESTSLYPVTMIPENYTLSRLCYETLFTYENGQAVPVLVDTYDISEDG